MAAYGFVMTGVRSPRDAKPKVFQLGDQVYGVSWMGRIVSVDQSLQFARVTARKIEEAFSRLPKQGIWDVPSLQASIIDFLTAASAGGPGWVPSPWF